MTPDLIKQAAQAIQQASSIVVSTGAGISKESGIPTFRDAQTGLWENYNPEDLATREGFLANPSMVWDWYDFRRNKVWDVLPNAGHLAIVELQRWCEQSQKAFTLITQNIDNLHQRAGSIGVLELHGNIFRYKCLDKNHPVSLDLMPEAERQKSLPHCPICNSFVRPDVVWFGEMLPESVLGSAFKSAEHCEVMLVVGTSGVVQPAASLPVIAKRSGATVIEVNPEPSELTDRVVDLFLQGPSGTMLPELLKILKP
jgi:NAD-dependent deacetylase